MSAAPAPGADQPCACTGEPGVATWDRHARLWRCRTCGRPAEDVPAAATTRQLAALRLGTLRRARAILRR